MDLIFSIDPGNVYSAYSILDIEQGLKPIRFGKITNEEMLKVIEEEIAQIKYFPIEMVASYGMPVGATVFETCVWIGRFVQAVTERSKVKPIFVYRKDEKMALCHSMKARDANIRQALIDRFGVVGTKKNPGWFYGVSKDVWSAIAVGVTFYDMNLSIGIYYE